MAESLSSVSQPGQSLWKHAELTACQACAAMENWTGLLTHLYRLLANWRCYEDGESLAEWARYRMALARAEVLLSEHANDDFPYDLGPLKLGTAAANIDLLTLSEIAESAPNPEARDVVVQLEGDRLQIESAGASVEELAEALGQELGLDFDVLEGASRQVYAHLKDLPPQNALNLTLGTAGLCVDLDSGQNEVIPLSVAATRDELVQRALVELHKFLIRYPDSGLAGEAYFTLACVHLLQDRRRLALGQLRVIERESPNSRWFGPALYVAGRIWDELDKDNRAEEKLLLAAESLQDGVTATRAKIWAARCQMSQDKYNEAADSFREALAGSLDSALRAHALYELALCLESAGASRADIEKRYRTVAMRHPDSEWADPAGYRLARLAFKAGDYVAAVRRYEEYLAREMPGAKKANKACHELLKAYLRTDHNLRAASLASVLKSLTDKDSEGSPVLLLLVRACREAGLERIGLKLLDEKFDEQAVENADVQLLMEKARLLTKLRRCEQARAVLDLVESGEGSSAEGDEVLLLRARIFEAEAEYKTAIRLCRRVALESDSPELRAQACELMGRSFENQQQFERAARAYAGLCPVSPVEDEQ